MTLDEEREWNRAVLDNNGWRCQEPAHGDGPRHGVALYADPDGVARCEPCHQFRYLQRQMLEWVKHRRSAA